MKLITICCHYLESHPVKRSTTSYKRVCYYTNWAQYRNGDAKFMPEDIDATLCDYVIYSFAKLNSAGELHPYEWNDESTDWSKGMYVFQH